MISIRSLEAEATRVEAMLREAGLAIGETRLRFTVARPRPIGTNQIRIANGLIGLWVGENTEGIIVEVKVSDLRRVIAERGAK